MIFAAMILATTISYNLVINSSLGFEPKDQQSEYINTRRSYRPQVSEKRKPSKVPTVRALPSNNEPLAEELTPEQLEQIMKLEQPS